MAPNTVLPAGDLDAEWLETDGTGGFASGTVGGLRTRRYHALLLAATRPPVGRVVLVNGIEAWVETPHSRTPLASQRYAPDVIHPDARPGIAAFTRTPWPTWTFQLPGIGTVEHEVFVGVGGAGTVLRWRRVGGEGPCRLTVRPLLSGRDYHALHHENGAFRFEGVVAGGSVAWQSYPGLPPVAALTNGRYCEAPDWYRRFLYTAERDRGLDDTEDLASPGLFSWDLAAGPAVMLLRTGGDVADDAVQHADGIMAGERARRGTATAPGSSVPCYVVARGSRPTLLAGYPWFTDWGRDTFIAMRGLLLATGRLAGAEGILLAWAGLVSEGMLPNRFPDDGGPPEYTSVDASLWFIVAVHDTLEALGGAVSTSTRDTLRGAVQAILTGYAAGTRHGIAADQDGLLRAGVPGLQLTWMDAKVDDWVVTPRVGKPVEVQALWINALRIAALWDPSWDSLARRAHGAFLRRFPNPAGGLLDVMDVDGEPGRTDARVRPNQILAVGGLPFPLLRGAAARAVIDLVEARLLTPMGLRTLAPDEPDYIGRYRGDRRARDGAYHQGTAWPWLIGPFVEAWLRVRRNTAKAKIEASGRFLAPLRAHLDQAGLGHVSEVADGDAPHTPGGCPFQAWSLGELLRAERMVAPLRGGHTAAP